MVNRLTASLIAAVLIVAGCGGAGDGLEHARRIAREDDRWTTPTSASEALADMGAALLAAAAECEATEMRQDATDVCGPLGTAAAVVQVAAVRIPACVADGVRDAREAVTTYLAELAATSDGRGEPPDPPAPPDC